MEDCINLDYDDTCEMFYDLDEDEIYLLSCDSDDGKCYLNFDECPYYTPAWEN